MMLLRKPALKLTDSLNRQPGPLLSHTSDMEDGDERATSGLRNVPELLWLVLELHTPEPIPSASVGRAGTNAAGGGFSTRLRSPVDQTPLEGVVRRH